MTAIFTTAETELNTQLTGLQEQLIALADLLRGQHERLTELVALNAQQSATITEQGTIITGLVAQVASQATELASQGAEIAALKAGTVTPPVVVPPVEPPVVVPPPEPEPEPDPAPTGAYVLVDAAALKARPTEGAAWDNLKAWADKPFVAPDLGNQDNQGDVQALAAALVFARTGNPDYRAKVVQALKAVRGTEAKADTLAVARFYAVPLAANLIGYEDVSWLAWLAGLRTYVMTTDRNYTLVSIDEQRPNNWRNHAGATRTAIDLLIGDTDDLKRAVQVFKGYLGDYDAYHDFKYGDDLSWQADPQKPVGINPTGATRDGVDLDGILPDDMRRGGKFPLIGTTGISYTYEALQGALVQAGLLDIAGYPAFEWSDSALLRAFTRIYKEAPPTGDDLWQLAVINAHYGTTYAVPASTGPGKSIIGMEWLFS